MKNQAWQKFSSSSFGDGELKKLDGIPEGFEIRQMPDAPQEYAPRLDIELEKMAMKKI